MSAGSAVEPNPDLSVSAEPLDVAIVGAGPVGVFLGILLAQRGLKVHVFERRTAPRRHSRAIGIHPPSLEALATAGLAEPLLAEAVKIRSGQLRSRGSTLGGLRFDRVSKDFPFVASLQQQRTEFLLAAKLQQCAPGALRRGVDISAVEQRAGLVRLHWNANDDDGKGLGSDRSFVDARILVGADGAHSLIRSAAGIGTKPTRYRDTYLMGDFHDTTTDGSAAVIWLEPDGVVESFPLPGGIRRWVIHTPALESEATAAQLCGRIEHRTGIRVAAETNSMLSAFEVRGQLAQTMYAGRTVLVGDAAHEVSPIGGQGMNLGWLDAAAMAPVIEEAVSRGCFPAARMRRVARTRMRAATVAVRQAQLNMAMGRPVRPWMPGPRDAALRLLLASPARPVLARAYSMRWL